MRISDWSSDVCSSDLAFYAAALTYHSEDFDKLRKIIREARERGIEMLPPSIEKSGVAFEPDTTDDGKPAVRWGMGSIKGLGSYAAPLVRSTRGKGITKIEDLAKALAPLDRKSTRLNSSH